MITNQDLKKTGGYTHLLFYSLFTLFRKIIKFNILIFYSILDTTAMGNGYHGVLSRC